MNGQRGFGDSRPHDNHSAEMPRSLLRGGSLKSEFYQVYANYFVSFTQAYSEAGVPIDAVTIQNEPHHVDNIYPTMRMELREQADFVNFLGPAFVSANITTTDILIWDHNWERFASASNILVSPILP